MRIIILAFLFATMSHTSEFSKRPSKIDFQTLTGDKVPYTIKTGEVPIGMALSLDPDRFYFTWTSSSWSCGSYDLLELNPITGNFSFVRKISDADRELLLYGDKNKKWYEIGYFEKGIKTIQPEEDETEIARNISLGNRQIIFYKNSKLVNITDSQGIKILMSFTLCRKFSPANTLVKVFGNGDFAIFEENLSDNISKLYHGIKIETE